MSLTHLVGRIQDLLIEGTFEPLFIYIESYESQLTS